MGLGAVGAGICAGVEVKRAVAGQDEGGGGEEGGGARANELAPADFYLADFWPRIRFKRKYTRRQISQYLFTCPFLASFFRFSDF